MDSDDRIVARPESIRCGARRWALPWALCGLAAVCSFGTTPASAQSLPATDSPWLGLKDLFGAKKPDVLASKPRPVSRPAAAASPNSADDAQALRDEALQVAQAPLNTKRAIWALAGESQGVFAFINDAEMVPQDGAIYTSVLFDYTSDLLAPNGAAHRSARARIRVPCSSGSESFIVASTLFSGNSGDGEVVFESLQKLSLMGTQIGQMAAIFVRDRSRAACQ